MRPTPPTRRPIESAPIITYSERIPQPSAEWAEMRARNIFDHIGYDHEGYPQPHACGIAPAVLAPLRLED